MEEKYYCPECGGSHWAEYDLADDDGDNDQHYICMDCAAIYTRKEMDRECE